MKKFKSKLKNQGGFTLIEMLIVVAIIAILVAVSIPLVQSSLDKARVATDTANERAAKAVAVVKYLTDETSAGTTPYYFHADTGILDTTAPATGYGKCSKHNGGYIKVMLNTNGTCTVNWEGTGVSTGAHDGDVNKPIS